MRQASWNEIFAPRRDPLTVAPEVPSVPSGWRGLFWWEDLVTFGLVVVIMLSVVGSIQRAEWVDSMPPLFPIALLGLLMGALLSRLRWPEGFIHLIALPVGAAGILGQLIGIMSGASPWERYQELHDRMGAWFHVAFYGGISNDDLPFILLVVSLCWLASYWCAWAVFRWRNVWLALLPAGGALTANFAFQNAEFSYAFVVFLLGGALLLTRLHLLERARAWRDGQTPYPHFLSLSVLHATFWIVIVLLGLAWLMPRADESNALDGAWNRATDPVERRVESLGRLFVGVDTKKPARIHNFEDYLPFLGSIELPDQPAVEIIGGDLDQPAYLRAQAYYVYTPEGWLAGSENTGSLASGQETQVAAALSERDEISITVINRGAPDDTIFTVGQPLEADVPTSISWWRNRQDVTSLHAGREVGTGSRYESTGSVSTASEDSLRAAGEAYPTWIAERYLELPEDFSPPIAALSAEIAGSEATPYDQALAIEAFLRQIPYSLDTPQAPRGQDPIEYFLFESQQGYFDYHASAMVVMLRSEGIPARLAVGYVIEPPTEDGEVFRYTVNEDDAYTWPEVYFPGLGWIEFNPTPNLPSIQRPGGEPTAGVPGSGDAGAPPAGLDLENLGSLFPEAEERAAEDAPLAGSSSADPTRWVLIALASAVALAAVSGAGGLTYAWLRGLRTLDPPARLWEQTVRLAGWTRVPPLGSETPHEYARTLGEQAGAPEAAELADAYVRHRFGGEQIGEAEAGRLELAWRTVRKKLLRRLWPL